MFYYPFIKVKYRSKLSKALAVQRLGENLLPSPDFELRLWRKTWEKPYSGKLAWDNFKISRNINYSNSFLPIIKGRITEQMGHTIIEVEYKLQMLVLIFISLWLGIVGIAGIVLLILSVFNNDFKIITLVPLAMFMFGFGLGFGGFNYECDKTDKDFQQIFEAEMVSEELN